MRYYSDELKKFFDTELQCISAEDEYRKKRDEKNARKQEVDEAFQHAMKLAKDYNKDYEDSYECILDDMLSLPKTIYTHIFG